MRGKSSLFNLINQQPDGKDSYEEKYQFLIKKRENTGLKHLNDSKAILEYSNDMNDIHKSVR